MPVGVEDRNADVWESLLVVADLAGGEWPEKARAAAVALVAASMESTGSLGVQLLTDLKLIFNGCDRLPTDLVIEKLISLPESPWGDLRGKQIDARGLSTRLKKYEVKPKQIRIGERNVRGYEKSDFLDSWSRYLPRENPVGLSLLDNATNATSVTQPSQDAVPVADVALVAHKSGESVANPPQCAKCGWLAQDANQLGPGRICGGCE
jgi:hypothetical protein